MFNRDKKLELVEKKATNFFTPPIIILDVDETLILGHNQDNFSINAFNHRLIKTLIQAGIKEVYLLTAFELKILKTKWERDEAEELLRLDLINHLEKNGITVKALVSNHDIVQSYDQTVSDPKEDTWISKSLPGDYYNTIIKPREKSIRDNPDINLNEDKAYQGVIEQQQKNRVIIEKIKKLYKSENIKSPLADLLFTSLKKEGVLSDSEPRTVLFLDDKMEYIKSVSEIAEKHKIEIAGLQIKNPYQQNYSDFLSIYYPILDYQNKVLAIYSELESELKSIKNHASQAQESNKRSLFSFLDKSKHRDVINSDVFITAIQQVLKVFTNVQNDIDTNITKHDFIGACNAMIRELIKRQKELWENQIKFSKKEQAIAGKITRFFGTAIDRLEKMRLSLGMSYQIEYEKKPENGDVSRHMTGLG